jgi:hypothetical protein
MAPTQVSDPLTYDIKNLIFTEIEEKTIENPKSTYFRVGIKTRYENGQVGDLIFAFDRSGSFGISDQFGITLSVQLHDREGPTERQRKTVEVIEKISEKAKDFLVENRKSLKKLGLGLVKEQLSGLSPIKFPVDEDNNLDTTKSPMINIKLLTKNQKNNSEDGPSTPKILTSFYSEDEVDENGDLLEVNPMDYVKKRCFVTCAVKVDGIFFGQFKKLQVKLCECNIKSADSKPRRLLSGFSSQYTPAPRATPVLETKVEDVFAEDKPLETSDAEKEEEEDDQTAPLIPQVVEPVSSRKPKSKRKE